MLIVTQTRLVQRSQRINSNLVMPISSPCQKTPKLLYGIEFSTWMEKKVTLRFKPFLVVFHLSKLLIPGVRIQMQMYFNNHSMWSVVYGGARPLRLTEADVNVRLFLAQVRFTPSIYRELEDDMKTGIVSYPTVRG